MEWNQVSEWFLKEIVTFGVRWIVVVVLGLIASLFFFGVFGHRYRKVTLDIEALKKAGGTTVVHNHMPVVGGPLDRGDIDEIKALTQAEYGALTVKKRKTLYLVVNREKD